MISVTILTRKWKLAGVTYACERENALQDLASFSVSLYVKKPPTFTRVTRVSGSFVLLGKKTNMSEDLVCYDYVIDCSLRFGFILIALHMRKNGFSYVILTTRNT